MAKSLKVNYIFNLINTGVGLLFPIVTFPYVTRVVMADGLGRIQFLSSIINYLSLLSAIGIPLYAVREIARLRDNIRERNIVTIEILSLHLLLTLAGYAIVFLLAFTINKIYSDIWLFLLLSTHIALNAIGIEWFYKGVEDFGYITFRSLIVRLACLVSLFLFVKSKDDLYIYAGITVFSEIGNYIFNFIHLRKYISFRDIPWRELNLKKHFRPSLRIFVLNLITSIYVNLDSVMLGFLSTTVAVGFYSSVTRLTKALLGIVTTLGTVLLPRLSNYISNGEIESFNTVAGKSSRFVITMAMPIVLCMIFSAPQLISVMCGSEFLPAIPTIQIISPIILFIGLSNLVGLQVLYSQGKEKFVIISTSCGAVTNFILNLILIPHFAQNGAALATVIAEFVVVATMMIIGRAFIPFKVLNKYNYSIALYSNIIVIPILLIQRLDYSDFVLLFFEMIAAGLLYFLLLMSSHNEFLTTIKETICKKKNK
jgi:O-antigen/teichoic acid export membrane protein